MRCHTRISILLFFILVLGNPTKARSQTLDLSNNAPFGQNRVVVFEAFMRST